jgi:hypothetical protein
MTEKAEAKNRYSRFPRLRIEAPSNMSEHTENDDPDVSLGRSTEQIGRIVIPK